jgi:uncharacterized protein YpmB
MQPQQSYAPPPQQPLPEPNMGAGQPNPDYSFIMEPPKPPKRPLFNFGGSSQTMRIILVVAAVFVLLIIFVGLKNILATSNKSAPSLVAVAQDQQELIHLAQSGTQNATSANLKNFAYTAQLGLQSEQKDLVIYLKNNGHKTSTKELNLGISKALDTQLSAAITTSSYDTTFKQTMQAKLDAYEKAIQSAYNQTVGPKGRALLTDDIKAADLLLKQLNS